MTRYELLNLLISKRGYESYLEIGVDQGACFNRIKCAKKVGVDPYAGSGREDSAPEKWKKAIADEYRRGPATHVMTSDEFFAQNKDTFDCVFIDGLHEAKQVEADIDNAIDCLSFHDAPTIVVHDCLPMTEEAQRQPRGDVWGWNGDAWKAIARFRTMSTMGVYTVDTDQGCAVIDPRRVDVMLAPHVGLDWEYFDANREHLMNIITIPEFLRRV